MVGEFNALADLSVQYLSRLSGTPLKRFQEPDYTAALSSILPVLLNRHPLYKKMKFGGCFLHQKPKVEFTSTKVTGTKEKCEAGDLLILCRQKIDGTERYNAVVFQLKMHPTPFSVPHAITKQGEKVQKELYSFWPPFSILGKTRLTYDIYPKTITPAAQYMFVRRVGALSKFSISYPDSSITLDKYENIGRCVYELVNWQTGRPITGPDDPKKDEWSRFIWDIVGVTKKSVYRRKNVGLEDEPRTTGDFFQMLIQDSCFDQGMFQFYPHNIKGELRYTMDDDETILNILRENQLKEIKQETESVGISLLFIDVENCV